MSGFRCGPVSLIDQAGLRVLQLLHTNTARYSTIHLILYSFFLMKSPWKVDMYIVYYFDC